MLMQANSNCFGNDSTQQFQCNIYFQQFSENSNSNMFHLQEESDEQANLRSLTLIKNERHRGELRKRRLSTEFNKRRIANGKAMISILNNEEHGIGPLQVITNIFQSNPNVSNSSHNSIHRDIQNIKTNQVILPNYNPPNPQESSENYNNNASQQLQSQVHIIEILVQKILCFYQQQNIRPLSHFFDRLAAKLESCIAEVCECETITQIINRQAATSDLNLFDVIAQIIQKAFQVDIALTMSILKVLNSISQLQLEQLDLFIQQRYANIALFVTQMIKAYQHNFIQHQDINMPLISSCVQFLANISFISEPTRHYLLNLDLVEAATSFIITICKTQKMQSAPEQQQLIETCQNICLSLITPFSESNQNVYQNKVLVFFQSLDPILTLSQKSNDSQIMMEMLLSTLVKCTSTYEATLEILIDFRFLPYIFDLCTQNFNKKIRELSIKLLANFSGASSNLVQEKLIFQMKILDLFYKILLSEQGSRKTSKIDVRLGISNIMCGDQRVLKTLFVHDIWQFIVNEVNDKNNNSLQNQDLTIELLIGLCNMIQSANYSQQIVILQECKLLENITKQLNAQQPYIDHANLQSLIKGLMSLINFANYDECLKNQLYSLINKIHILKEQHYTISQ